MIARNIGANLCHYYIHMTIVNDDSSIINKLGASLTDVRCLSVQIYNFNQGILTEGEGSVQLTS
jgi:hypothetical protein